jgi:hypothetical protein
LFTSRRVPFLVESHGQTATPIYLWGLHHLPHVRSHLSAA